MKEFIIKHKITICYWLIFLTILFYFAPIQNNYYLDDDIELFKKQFFYKILLGIGVSICLLLYIYIIKKINGIKKHLTAFIYFTLKITFILFIFQDLILAGLLFINRQYKRESFVRSYIVEKYPNTSEQNKSNIWLYDLSKGQVISERKLVESLYYNGVKEKDTVTKMFDKGLLGLAFSTKIMKPN